MLQLLDDGRVFVPETIYIQNVAIQPGFKSDGATIPRFAWSILGYHPLHAKVLKAAILHDYLISISWPKADADNLFRRHLEGSGVPKIKSLVMWAAVRIYRGLK